MNSTLMTKRQVAELLKFINDIYPNMDVTQSRIDTWSKMLKDQNPAIVMKNAEKYAVSNKFPPSIADLRTEPFQKSRDQIKHEQMLKENGLM